MYNYHQLFQVSLSYLEIYNENIRDLLEYTGQTLELFEENSQTGIIKVAGLSWIAAKSTEEVKFPISILNE